MQFYDDPCYKDSGVADVRCVVLHHTAGTEQGDYNVLWGSDEVSIHFLIGKTGNVHYGVRMGRQAWHCYPSEWNGLSDLNQYSIGIELSNLGNSSDPFTPEQLSALDQVLTTIIRPLYGNLPIVRHRDISVSIGKIDPADNFPWHLYSGGIEQVTERTAVTGAQLQEDDMAQPTPVNDERTKWQGYVDFTTDKRQFVIGVDAGKAPGVPEPGRVTQVNIFIQDARVAGGWRLMKQMPLATDGPSTKWRMEGYIGEVSIDSVPDGITVQLV